MGKNPLEQVVCKSSDTAERYKFGKQVPMETFISDYINSKIDVTGDFEEFLYNRNAFVDYTLTPNHFKFFFSRMIPEVLIHSKKQDERIIRSHYDRGNDFFRAFLGPRMIYTAGLWLKPKEETLELAQDRKMQSVCQKLNLKKGKKMLDIGCGWGTLVCYAAKHYDVDATGITIAQDGTEHGNKQIAEHGMTNKARIMRIDYRDIPKEKYDAISSLEMIEHVGLKNYQKFIRQIYDLLSDDGIFYLQQAGLRANPGLHKRGPHWEDLVWGLFMNEFIFSGADASTPLGYMVNNLQQANFEVSSIENVGIHYSHTIQAWYNNWMGNKEQILGTYGEWWFRLWQVFLKWSVIIASQGSSTCYAIVAHKNLNSFDRNVYVGPNKYPYYAFDNITPF
ncbi:hypothetical protein CHS0354_000768 [Potamilus streckersoni]|uniref:sphingolipid C(9)-methyltransferase n=1 Tax=Potamilus streckersoni TaxID=2493646 RepID=A0AAE0W881_9BIVA|nr:hypothetical protein CHS0354_000768 [Potamilus streckersoni]